MEMSNLAAKLKSLKLKLDEDLIVHLVLISRTNGPSMSLYLIVCKKKRGCREIRLKVLILLQPLRIRKKRTLKVLRKGLLRERNQRRMRNLPASSVRSQDTCRNSVLINLTFVLINTWWVDSSATTHIRSRPPSDDERFIFMGDENKVAVEAIGTFRLQLKTGFYLDLFEIFVMSSFRKNLIFISSLDKFGFSYSFGNNKVSLYQNSNIIGCGSLIDNLYMLDVVSSHNKILQIGSRGTKQKSSYGTSKIQRLVSDEIIKPLNLSNFKVCVECIKGKRTNIRKLGAERAKDVLKLIHTNICGFFPIASWNGQQYFITFVDDYSSLSKLKLNFNLKIKLKPSNLIVVVNTMVERRNRTLKNMVRRDPSERRHAIPYNYIVFLQEHEDDIGLTKDDPINFCQAMKSSNSQKWIGVMKDEMKSIDKFGVPQSLCKKMMFGSRVKPIGCKWIFKTKKNSNCNIERYKAHLVAKGFTQKEGITYKETFSPVSSKDSFRTIMTLVAYFDLELHQMDVKTTFLNGDINEIIYMVQPENCANVVDDYVYHKFNGSKYILLVLYVDDIILASSDTSSLHETKRFLTKSFKMKDLGEASFVLGMQILRDRSQDILRLSQDNYISKVLNRFGMKDSKPGDTSIAKEDKLSLK
ncbi:hypothetical protein CR513_06923, partial [Mucuna pruriens]